VRFDDLAGAWQRRGAGEAPPAEPSRQLVAVREKARALEIAVRRRDRVETLVAILLLPIFGTFAVVASDLLARVGAAIVAAACVAIPLILRRARRRAPDLGLPVATFLRLELEFVVRQRRLLLTVPLWYLAPLGIGVILFFAGGSPSPWLTAAYAAVVVIFFGALWRLNRRAVTTQLEPWEREVRLWIELDVDLPSADDRSDRG
jgi:hypothetical protein